MYAYARMPREVALDGYVLEHSNPMLLIQDKIVRLVKNDDTLVTDDDSVGRMEPQTRLTFYVQVKEGAFQDTPSVP